MIGIRHPHSLTELRPRGKTRRATATSDAGGRLSAPQALERHREEAITERERALTGVDDDPGS